MFAALAMRMQITTTNPTDQEDRSGKKDKEETMKKVMFLTVASAILIASGAYGQKLSADVPFGFTANKLELAAGQYDLKVGSPIPQGHVHLWNSAARTGVFVRTINPEYTRGESKPRLVFRCADGHCALAEIWTADSIGYRVGVPKSPAGARIQMATVYLTRSTNAD
jgi:hypothetical protein